MREHGAAERHAFRDRGANVLGREIVHEGVLHQHGGHREAAGQVGDQRQHGVIGHIADLAQRTQVVEVVADEATQGEPPEVAREHGQERDRDHVAGDGVAEEDNRRGQVVERRLVADGLDDAERDTHAVREYQRGDAVEDRDREAVLDGVPDRLRVPRGRAEIQLDHLAQPLHVTHDHGLVEAVVRLELIDLLVGQRACAVTAQAARRGTNVRPRHSRFLQHALDGPARHQARHREHQDRHADEGRHDE